MLFYGEANKETAFKLKEILFSDAFLCLSYLNLTLKSLQSSYSNSLKEAFTHELSPGFPLDSFLEL